MDDLIQRLTIKAGVIESGERIAWGSDSALMREAAAAIADLSKQLDIAKSITELTQLKLERMKAVFDMDMGQIKNGEGNDADLPR